MVAPNLPSVLFKVDEHPRRKIMSPNFKRDCPAPMMLNLSIAGDMKFLRALENQLTENNSKAPTTFDIKEPLADHYNPNHHHDKASACMFQAG